MWNQKLCLGLSDSFGLPYEEQIQTLAKIGFDAFFADLSDPAQLPLLPHLAQLAKQSGIACQSLHAPYARAADLWQADADAADAAVTELLNCLDDCKRNEIPLLIVHAFIGFDAHTPTPRGVERFAAVVKAAEGSGVKIALENTEGEEYLFTLLDAFSQSNAVGFCWDSGHEMCYNHAQNLLARYGDCLLATHLNDNLGIRAFDGTTTWIDDLHLIPGDGIADWDLLAARLAAVPLPEYLTFELTTRSKPDRHENDGYARMAPVDYLTAVYARACKIAAKIQRAKERIPK